MTYRDRVNSNLSRLSSAMGEANLTIDEVIQLVYTATYVSCYFCNQRSTERRYGVPLCKEHL